MQDVALALFVISDRFCRLFLGVWALEQEEIHVEIMVIVHVDIIKGLTTKLWEKRIVAILVTV